MAARYGHLSQRVVEAPVEKDRVALARLRLSVGVHENVTHSLYAARNIFHFECAPELDHMRNALTATVGEWTPLLARKLYVFLGKGPINLRSIAHHKANVVRMRYRGIEFYIHQIRDNRWNWHIPTRIEIGIPITGVVGGNKEATIAKCHSVIDERLGLNRGSAVRSSSPRLCKQW
jgi:hypothetical protein